MNQEKLKYIKLIETYQADGRKTIEQLYQRYKQLIETPDWLIEEIIETSIDGINGQIITPILGFKTKKQGPAIYLIAGIHGEEAAGPNALAESINFIKELGKKIPFVLLPLCNPVGYSKNWRYYHKPDDDDPSLADGMSVGDCDHLLLNNKNQQARLAQANNPFCLSLSKFILQATLTHPPFLSIDFHEDTLIDQGYLYSHGKLDRKNNLARKILDILQKNGIVIKKSGKTCYGERIISGIINPQQDGSIDELMAAEKIIINGKIIPGPNATKVFALETPNIESELAIRIRAYKAVIEALPQLI